MNKPKLSGEFHPYIQEGEVTFLLLEREGYKVVTRFGDNTYPIPTKV